MEAPDYLQLAFQMLQGPSSYYVVLAKLCTRYPLALLYRNNKRKPNCQLGACVQCGDPYDLRYSLHSRPSHAPS